LTTNIDRPERLQPQPGPAAVPSPSPTPIDEPWHLNVLVVEDNPADLHWTTTTLAGMEEFEVSLTHAGTVAAAREAFETQDFDVALIDYHLPDGYGDDVVQALMARASGCAPVLLSGHTMSEVSHFALRSGALAAISKDDLNPTLLETTIRFALRNQALIRAASAAKG
jgi:DNA-binding NarL/FixJ family response regulator